MTYPFCKTVYFSEFSGDATWCDMALKYYLKLSKIDEGEKIHGMRRVCSDHITQRMSWTMWSGFQGKVFTGIKEWVT